MNAAEPLDPLALSRTITAAYDNRALAQVNDHEVRMGVMTEAYGWHLHPDSDETFLVVDGELVIEFEDRYLQAKLDPAFVVRLGAADLPWVPYVEGQYGYRHIENTLIDRTNFGTSADWGIHVLGDLAGGLVSYQVSVVDGGGYRNVKVTKSVDVEGRVSLNYKGFYAAAGGYSGKRGNDTQGAVTPHTATRENLLAGYKNKTFNAGLEYFHAKDWNNVATTAADKSDGWSAFGNVNFAKTWSLFGKYEWVKPTKLSNDNLKDRYFNVGLQWEPVKIVDLALVYKRDKVNNGTFGTQNGTIGGPNPTGTLIGGRGTYDEFGLFGQLRF